MHRSRGAADRNGLAVLKLATLLIVTVPVAFGLRQQLEAQRDVDRAKWRSLAMSILPPAPARHGPRRLA